MSKARKIICSFFIVVLIGLGISYYIFQLDLQVSARGDLLMNLRDSLFYGMSALALVFLILFFLPNAFRVWRKFAIWYLPIAVLIFISYKGRGYFDPAPEQIYQWVSGLYVILSFLIIVRSELKNRKAPNA